MQPKTYTPPASVVQTAKPAREAARAPDFKSDGIALWLNQDQDGKNFVNVRLVGRSTMTAYEVPHDAREQFPKGGRTPDFRGHGVSVWFETSKAGNQYCKARIAGAAGPDGDHIPLFRNTDQSTDAPEAVEGEAAEADATPVEGSDEQ